MLDDPPGSLFIDHYGWFGGDDLPCERVLCHFVKFLDFGLNSKQGTNSGGRGVFLILE
jgi:hypothetical protein